jgi:hypothetical protein
MQACPGCGAAAVQRGQFCPACGTGAVDGEDGTDQELATAATGIADVGPAESLIGKTVGDFVIEGVIGGGSFGTVYRGRQLGLDRPVAVKVPTYEIAADPVQARRFAREARAAARIVHPGVVAIYAAGELDDGRPYLAMQLIDGAPLDRILDDGPLPALRALRIVRSIASALSDTHAADVVHRDLKPTNIMWRRDRNGDDRITLVDFGIAVCRPGNADATRLTINGLIGTPHYMSPEQAHGEQVDARADLYALGCLLFELVTGTTPFTGSGFEVLLAHLGGVTPRASERNPEIPAAVDDLIERLMQKQPADRPGSADEVVAMIDDAIAARIALDGARAWRAPTSGRWRGHRWFATMVAGALALAASAAGAYFLHDGVGEAADAVERGRSTQGSLAFPPGVALRQISNDDGELIVRTTVPEVIRANVAMLAYVEIRTKLGGAFDAKQVIVTVEDPHHKATAQTAGIHGGKAGRYAFHHTFGEPGTYVVRVFPSESETVSTIELDVAP